MDEGKTMGLAAYGKYSEKIQKKFMLYLLLIQNYLKRKC